MLRDFYLRKITKFGSVGYAYFEKLVHCLTFGDFFKNGSAGQTTVLMTPAAKFCVKSRSPFSNVPHHDPRTLGKLQIILI